jgi:3-hydroxyisobutyrate dehydrogenase
VQDIRHVGYIGLGIMGGAMAANLLRAGFELTAWNRTPGREQPLLSLGARLASSPRDLARRGPQAICINVTDTPDVEAVIFGPDGLAHEASPGLIVIDHSTIRPDSARAFADRLAAQGVHLVDAPVSGGDVGARNGTLTIMAGAAQPAVFERCLPLFQAVGRTIALVGGPGMGQVCKACNQVAVAVNLLGVCEAMALAQRCGLDPAKMIEVVQGGAGASWQLGTLGPRVLRGDLDPGFKVRLLVKDLAIVANRARALGLPLPLTFEAAERFTQALNQGLGDQGTQAVSRVYESVGGFRFHQPPAAPEAPA